MSHPTKTLHVVIVNYRQVDATVRCAALARADHIETWRTHVTIVDNSCDTNPEGLDQLGRAADTLIVSDHNGGWAGGNNQGLARALADGADAIMLLNNDVELEAGAIAALVHDLQPGQLTTPLLLGNDRRRWVEPSVLDPNTAKIRPSTDDSEPNPFIPGAALVAFADTWRNLGEIDESYFMYWEDVVLAMRANRLGISLTVNGAAVGVHNTSMSSASDGANPFKWYYISRNRMWAIRKRALPINHRRAWLETPRVAARDIAIVLGAKSAHPYREALAIARGTFVGAFAPMGASKAYR